MFNVGLPKKFINEYEHLSKFSKYYNAKRKNKSK